ncbi:cobaltochelatase subunit CobN [Alkalinema pantanalense CENA528]|uniref:cobaltochelatase subunit CobN n=1 Tax=Alkalinema pantanalense TaxID=1620705 RepID=UPI003D6FB45C
MHRIATTPGGWNPEQEGVIVIEQQPAPIVFLTAADTEIQALAQVCPQLPCDFPAIRTVNLLHLQQPFTIDHYAETVLEQAQIIVIRLLGGMAYWGYGLEVVQELSQRTGASLIVLPGDDKPDPALMSRSTLPLQVVNRCWRYWTEGGLENVQNALLDLANHCLGHRYSVQPPQPVPKVGCYPTESTPLSWPKVGILFYRAHYLTGNTAPIAALCEALRDRQLTPVPLFVSSLRDPEVIDDVLTEFQPKDGPAIQVLLNTTSFSLISPLGLGQAQRDTDPDLLDTVWQQLDVPIFQVIFSGGTAEQWRSQVRGLSPRDVAMNVALPEVDGRIITRAISFKSVQTQHPQLQTEVVGYEPIADRVKFVADLAANWVRLRQTPIADRKIALVLANYPTRNGRLANGVGLDTPASCVEILKVLKQAGYTIENAPQTSDELIQRLTQGITNDPESQTNTSHTLFLDRDHFDREFSVLPQVIQQQIQQRWNRYESGENHERSQAFPIAGIDLGNVFVGIQPSRGYDRDPALNYHAPDLEPTLDYLAFYSWLRSQFGSHAIVHVGKHGNLEWLPGKSVALSEVCYPEVALGTMPHFYPFIVNDPGEGSQAKRRAQAVIIDHLTPPMTRAELYGNLQQLENLVDEYYEAMNLNPSRMGLIREKITELIAQEHLDRDWQLQANFNTAENNFEDGILNHLDRNLCELKEAQIRDGLHIFGQCPQGTQLRDLIIAIARHPQPGRLGLTRAIAEAWNLEFDPLTADPAEPCVQNLPNQFADNREGKVSWRTVGDGIAAIEAEAIRLIDRLLDRSFSESIAAIVEGLIPLNPPNAYGEATPIKGGLSESIISPLQQELYWIANTLLPNLQATSQELTQLLHGLSGGYVPAAPSGAPTRGRPEVLPTGRNFYSVDIRAIPTESAWDVGRRAAEALVERYTQEHGDYPKTLGLSIWGTSTMRTGGDDLAEALALLGVQPIWDGSSRRVVDFEIIPLSILDRPRVDVTLRISGFFRDAFPNLIDLFDQAVAKVAALDEPEEDNPLAARCRQESIAWQAQGLTEDQAIERSRYRIFGSKPGAYGAGLQGLIEAQNWTTDADLAQAYINWSSYAYTGAAIGHSAPEAFAQRLQQLEIVLHNQDNREHDLLDSDDYYQFQGGLTAAVRTVQGRQPQTYFGDHTLPERPRIRTLQEEIAKVYRSRVVNPKWIAGAMRHGYKGAFEMAATVDYLFAYDATAHCVEDHMYQGVAQAYVLDPTVQTFVQQHNPWALRDMSERLLEAHQRGLWENANPTTIAQLQSIVLDAEGTIEERQS